MKKVSVRIAFVAAVAPIAAACTPSGPAPTTWKVKPSAIEVVRQNSFNVGDRPYVVQIGFRSKLGVANSSATQIVSQCYSQRLPAADAAPAGTTVTVPAGSA